MKRNGFALPLVLIVLVVGVVAGITATFLLRSKSTSLPQPTQTVTQQLSQTQATSPSQIGKITDWKVFKSSRFPYQISYPTNWLQKEELPDDEIAEYLNFNSTNFEYSVRVIVWNNPKKFSPLDWYNDRVGRKHPTDIGPQQIPEKPNTTVSGFPAYRGFQEESAVALAKVVVYIQRGDKTYEISLAYDGSITKDLTIFDQILSTFKFLD